MITAAHNPARAREVRCGISARRACAVMLGIVVGMVANGSAQRQASQSGSIGPARSTPNLAGAVPLDGVIAVVNNQVILSSDLDLEMRFDRLLPINTRQDSSATKTLQRLITRSLIEQQIVQEDPHGLEVAPGDLETNLGELRQNLPACRKRDCTSPAGWAAYLATLGLTTAQVDTYWSNRMALLRFIEQRFRSGIRITPEEIQKYYQETLLPQYSSAAEAPPVEKISARIQEILLQQRVTALFNDWLKSLKAQGQVEVLEPSLQAAATFDGEGEAGAEKQDSPPAPGNHEPVNSEPGIPLSAPAQSPAGPGPALTPVPTPVQPNGPHGATPDRMGGAL